MSGADIGILVVEKLRLPSEFTDRAWKPKFCDAWRDNLELTARLPANCVSINLICPGSRMVWGRLRESGSHLEFFDRGSASVCLVDFSLCSISLFDLIERYPAYSL
jgi:hypothetical protein